MVEKFHNTILQLCIKTKKSYIAINLYYAKIDTIVGGYFVKKFSYDHVIESEAV